MYKDSNKINATEYVWFKFLGDEKIRDLLHKLFELLEFEKYGKEKEELGYLEFKHEKNNIKIKNLKRKILDIKKQKKVIIFNKEVLETIKSYRDQIRELIKINKILNKEISKLKDPYLFKTYELKMKFKDLFEKIGFTHISTDVRLYDKNTIETYEFNGNEKILAEVASKKIKELESKLREDINEIKKRFHEPLHLEVKE